MKKLRSSLTALVLSGFLFVFAGCATTIKVNVQRPAELDLNGASSISVLPFQTSLFIMPDVHGRVSVLDAFFSGLFSSGEDYRCASYLTDNINKTLLSGKFYRLVDSNTVHSQLLRGETPDCDIYLSGRIDYLTSFTETERCERKKDDKIVYYDQFRKRIKIGVSYMVIDAKTSTVMDIDTYDFETFSGWYDNPSYLPGEFNEVRYYLDSIVSDLSRKIQPYYETKKIKLLEDKTKNPDLKTANEYAKNKLYQKSYDVYREVYDSTGDFTAGYNSAMLQEVLGNLDEARSIMDRLVDETGDKRAMKALSDINNEILKDERLKNQLQK